MPRPCRSAAGLATLLFASATLTAALAGACAGRADAATDPAIQSKQAAIEGTRRRLEGKRGELRLQEVRAQDLRRALAQTSGAIEDVRSRLVTIDGQLARNEAKLAWNQTQLAAARATLKRHDDALRRRLVDAYERGDLDYAAVLLASTSFNDFAERWQDIRYLIGANQKTVRERRAAADAVALEERHLESRRVALDRSLQDQQHAQYQLAALATQRAGLLKAAEAQRRSVATQVAQLEELSAQQEAGLEAYIREQQRKEEARRAAEAAERRRAAQLAGQEAPPPAEPGGSGASGGFAWPVSGPITSPFGMRSNPFGGGFEMHPGIDIGAPMGATITAAAGGRVIFAGWYGGYGNAVIIDHGSQTSTLYGHCSQLFVSNQQDVERGQAVGAVGSTGVSTGPHLHFEVRVNGVAVDPTSRLR